MNKTTLAKKNIVKSVQTAFLLYCLGSCFFSFGQNIQVTNVSPNPNCGGQTITITFTATNGNGNPSYFNSSSLFVAYLSSSGGVAPYTSLGNLTMSPYGFVSTNGYVHTGIQGTIDLPANLSGVYRIAVGSSSPTFNGSTGLGASSTFNVNSAPVGGSVTGGTTVCPGSNSTLLTLSGYTGTINKWQSSTVANFSSNVTDIANTSTTYTAINVSASTYYRAVVTNGTCTANSSTTTIQVASGTPSADQNICFNLQPANITLTNYQGTVQQWQSSTDNITFYDISGATAPTLTSAQMGNLVQTTYYRAIVDGGVPCGVMNSNVVTVIVSTASFGGTVSPSSTTGVCPSTTTVLTLSGYTGSIVKWQSSTNSNFNQNFVTDIYNYTNTLSVTNLTTKTYYRALVQNGGCSGAISTQAFIDAINNGPTGGTISPASTNLCSATNSTVLTLAGSNGVVSRWESSPVSDFSSGVTTISNTTTSLTVTNLSTTTYYRTVVTKSGCTAYSSVASITVYPSLSVSITGNNGPICSGGNAVFNLTGTSGAIVTYSINGGSNQAVALTGGAGTVTVTGAASNQTLNLVSISSGSCSTTISGSSTVTVNASPTASISGNNGPICSGSNAVFNLTGTSGATVTYKINGGSNQTVVLTGGVATVTITAATINQTLALVSVSLGSCSATLSGSSTVTVNAMPIVSISGNNSPICSGSNAVFNLSGTSGATVTYTINGGSNQNVTLTGGTATVTITAAAVNQTLALVSISLGSCSQSVSGNSTVTVNGTTTWTGLGGDSNWFNTTNWSCNAIPNSTSNVVINSATVLIGANASAGSITLNGTSSLTVNSGYDITVTNAVTTASGAIFSLQNNANLLQVNAVANTGNIEVNRESSALKRLDYTLWSSPVVGQNLLAFSPLTVTTRFYVYNSATNAYSAIVPSTNSFQLGKGYLIRVPDNWSATTATKWNGKFTGVPNNGNITLSPMYNGGNGLRFNGIGNPYPSPVSMLSFVNGNASNITGTLYFWRKSNSTATDPGYCTWTTGGFTSNNETQVFDPNGVLRTGQGFIVEMLPGATSVSFTNSMRVGDHANQFFKANSEQGTIDGDRIWLNLTKEGGGFSQMLLGYFANATLGVDNGIDGALLGNPSPLLCSMINNVDYVIQGRPPFTDTDVVPLRLKTTTSGNYTITLDHVDGLFLGNQDIFINDKFNNVTHSLKSGGYTFQSAAGDFPDRFEIAYQGNLLQNNQQSFNVNSLIVYQEGHDVIVSSNGILLKSVQFFDIHGRALLGKTGINASKVIFNTVNVAEQVLLVKIISTDGIVVNKKIVFVK